MPFDSKVLSCALSLLRISPLNIISNLNWKHKILIPLAKEKYLGNDFFFLKKDNKDKSFLGLLAYAFIRKLSFSI